MLFLISLQKISGLKKQTKTVTEPPTPCPSLEWQCLLRMLHTPKTQFPFFNAKTNTKRSHSMFRNASLSCCWQLYRRNLCEEAIHHSSDLKEHQNRAALRFRVSVLSLVAHSPLHSHCKSGKAKEWQIALAGDLIYLVLVTGQLRAGRKRREHDRSLPLTLKTSGQLKY